jgi:hypothetical protein
MKTEMKYRCLTDDELKLLADDLKHFLIVNGVHAEEWEHMNKENPSKAIQLVELFSDTVLDKVYSKIEFLEHRSPEACLVFHFDEAKIELISIQRNQDSTLDLSTPENIHEALAKHANQLSFFKMEKQYSKDRNSEIHQMIDQGCFVSSHDFWNALLIAIA